MSKSIDGFNDVYNCKKCNEEILVTNRDCHEAYCLRGIRMDIEERTEFYEYIDIISKLLGIVKRLEQRICELEKPEKIYDRDIQNGL